MKRLQHWIEYAGLRLGLFLLDRLSLDAAELLAVRVADIGYTLSPRRRRITRENIRRSGVATDPASIDRIARASFRHFAVLVVESLKSDTFLDEAHWRDRTELDIAPATHTLFQKQEQGVILVSGHLGNWEIAAQLLSYLKPVVGVTRDMNNPLTDRLMKERKPRNRFRLTPKHDAGAGRFLEALKEGELLALLVDQHASGHGIPVDFFGVPASTHTSPAMLHFVTGAPLVFGYCIRTGPMRFKLVIQAPRVFTRSGDRKQDVRTVLECLNRELETVIRQYPDQYLWAHRRWRGLPPLAPVIQP